MSWWKESVVYQIYPRSFKDSNGDGIGDLQGVISKFDYLSSLGIDVVWLSPIYKSPQVDNGYDISDYRQIDECFGTMADFHALLEGLHMRKIKLIMDLVVNHTSDEHEWFKSARSSRESPFYDYYHWWGAERGTPPARWSSFDPESNAWTYNSATDSYYLHYFSAKQPDLKWETEEVRESIYSMMRFWLDKGVDGFRMDVITLISKDLTFPPLPEKYKDDYFQFYAQGPRLHEFLKEMNRKVLSKYDILTVAEGIGIHDDCVLEFVDPSRHELNMLYHFDGVAVEHLEKECPAFDLVRFKRIHSQWEGRLAEKGWGTVYLGNHDQPRMLSRFGDESSPKACQMLTTFLLTMRDTPFCYQGDEIGMTNANFESVNEYRDISTLTRYEHLVTSGQDPEAFLIEQRWKGRDNARTPMQWNKDVHAGFSDAEPWLRVNSNHRKGTNVESQERDPTSNLNFYRKAVQLRRRHNVLIYGDYQLLDPQHPHIFAYTRTSHAHTDQQILVLLNFSPLCELFDMTGCDGDPWLNNYETFRKDQLFPWQALVLPMTLKSQPR